MEKRIALLLLAFLSLPISAQAGELLNQFDRPRRERKSDDPRQWQGVTFFNAFGMSAGVWNAVIDSEIRIDKANVIGTPVDFGPNLGIDIEPTRIYLAADAGAFLEKAGFDPHAVAAEVDGAFMSAFVRATRPQVSSRS